MEVFMKKHSLKLISSLAIIIFSIFFSFPSFFDNNNNLPNFWNKNKLKLGLDLQGGSQLLLQVETEKAIIEKLTNQFEDLRTELSEADIDPLDFKLVKDIIIIKVRDTEIEKLKKIINTNNQLEAKYDQEVARIGFSNQFIREFQSSIIL